MSLNLKKRLANQYRRYLKTPSMTGVRTGRCQGLMDAALILLGPESPEFVALKKMQEGARKEGLVL